MRRCSEVRFLHAGGISAERHHTSIGRTTTTTASTGLKGTEGLKKLLLVFAATLWLQWIVVF